MPQGIRLNNNFNASVIRKLDELFILAILIYSGNLCIIFFLLHDGILLEADVGVHQILDFNITVVTRTGTNRKTNLLCSRHVASVLDLFTMVRKYFPGDFKFCYKITLKKIQGISSYLYPQPLHKTVGEPP